MYTHASVLPTEILDGLRLQSGSMVADVTAGGGGHLKLIAEAVGSTGRVLALDQDPRAHEPDAAGGVAQEYPWVKLIRARFSELEQVLKETGSRVKPGMTKDGPGMTIETPLLDALLADIGVSSPQLDDASRGLSFRQDGPIDMRMDPTSGISAYELIQQSSEEELANIIYNYGEERHSRRIARVIKNEKNLSNSTLALANLVARAYRGPRARIHPATRTFQALRIAVNHELEELESLLNQLPRCVKIGGRVAIISFHSLEDRLVKNFFRNNKEDWKIINKKPIIANESELKSNPRAKSAKLRIAERVNL
ncbi:MAG: 16S rRNA (cytosine(1402)-N(4))-methyltransferase RsmH [Deltaproteobacteria bacterium]|nr:16S rRNA (cytosine(1402)-N(4))-methyltransferase RsmH [Deltaproteobacteria bacterium]